MAAPLQLLVLEVLQGFIAKLPPVTFRGSKPKNPQYPSELKTIGDHIRTKRLDLGLRQADVALRFGVTVDTVLNWETEKTELLVHSWAKIVSFLGYCPYQRAETLGDKLRLYRIHRGLPHKAMAKILGVDPGSILRWETGKRRPTVRMGRKIIDVIHGHDQRVAQLR